ncbi:MAG: ATP-binding protein [Anaerolineales bacterium]|nr:ATP-binding protein [Anaerolineales bacterium]
MDDAELKPDERDFRNPEGTEVTTGIRSIRDLIDRVTGRHLDDLSQGDAGFAEQWPFPFLALVGQKEMKLGLILTLINPNVGGVLLVGPRGTGKTTSVRSLMDLMPYVNESNCYYGCLEEDVETGGIESLCPSCAQKYKNGERLSSLRPAKLVELPLNAKMEDVIGSLDERAAASQRLRVKRGILSHADKNILYIDEVNLLKDEVVDVILDASAQGSYTVRRGQFSATYRSRFTLVGTMNPEEGSLRPQILDRFGLRLMVQGLKDVNERQAAYQLARVYMINPKRVVEMYADEMMIARDELLAAREIVSQVELPDKISRMGLDLIRDVGIASLRAEITLFEAARAMAAADNRLVVDEDDLRQVAIMALRLRRSKFIEEYFAEQDAEETEISEKIIKIFGGG